MLTAGRMLLAASAPRDPPVLSSPTDVPTGPTTGYGTVATDTPTGTLYWYVSTSSTPPSATDLKAGTGAVAYGNQTVSGTGTYEVEPTGLTELTAYTIHYLHEVSGRQSAIVSGDGFTTPSSDTTAPTLSAAAATNVASTTATVGCTTNEGNGTVYWVVTTSSTKPTATQVKAGQDHTGSSVATGKKGSWAAPTPSGGARTGSATGLSASTNYWGHFAHEDAVGNKSTVISASFTTQAAVTPGSQTFNSSGSFTVPSFNTLTVHVYSGGGGGGGGGINSNFVAGDGGNSSFGSPTPVTSGGGKGGQGREAGGNGGSGGGNQDGEDGTATSAGSAYGGAGGSCLGPDGGSGAARNGPTTGNAYGVAGSAPGGGGSGGVATGPGGGGGGGAGEYKTQTFTTGQLTVGASIPVTVGAGGTAGSGWRAGGAGGQGRVVVEWA